MHGDYAFIQTEEGGLYMLQDDAPEENENVQLGKWYTLFDEDSTPDVDDHGY